MLLGLPSGLPQESSSLVQLVRSRAMQQPSATAFVFLDNGERESDRMSFSELDTRARQIAAALQQTAEPGARALLLYPQGLDFVAAFFGCLYAGVVAVPAKAPGANRRSARLQTMLADAEPVVALAPRAIYEKARSMLSDHNGGSPSNWVCTDALAPELVE